MKKECSYWKFENADRNSKGKSKLKSPQLYRFVYCYSIVKPVKTISPPWTTPASDNPSPSPSWRLPCRRSGPQRAESCLASRAWRRPPWCASCQSPSACVYICVCVCVCVCYISWARIKASDNTSESGERISTSNARGENAKTQTWPYAKMQML